MIHGTASTSDQPVKVRKTVRWPGMVLIPKEGDGLPLPQKDIASSFLLDLVPDYNPQAGNESGVATINRAEEW